MQSLLSHLNINTRSRREHTSVDRLAIFSAFRLPDMMNAFGLFPFFAGWTFFFAFFLSALFPECGARWGLWESSIPSSAPLEPGLTSFEKPIVENFWFFTSF
jgi:hypothetical protein